MTWPGVDDREPLRRAPGGAEGRGVPHCSRCGAELPRHMAYCLECGAERFPTPSQPPVRGLSPAGRLLPGVTWGLKEVTLGTLAALVIFFAAAMAILLPFMLMDVDVDPASPGGLGLNAIFYVVVLAVPLFVARRSTAGALRALGFRRLPWRLTWRIPVGLLSVYAVIIVSTLIIAALGFRELEPQSNVPEGLFEERTTVIVALVVVGVGAPVAEEVFFRGFMLAGLVRSIPLLPALAVSGLLFGLAHQDCTLLVPFSLVGVVLGWTYLQSGSLWASIAVHAAFNLISLGIGVSSA